MKLHLHTELVDAVLQCWMHESTDFSQVYRHPVFVEMRKRAEDFQQKRISDDEYLHALLHSDGIDMQSHAAEIRRNANLISGAELSLLAAQVQQYLPLEAHLDAGEIHVYLFIGAAGYALNDAILLDPSPCSWFPEDGSHPFEYLDRFIGPTLRHELHHMGFNRMKPQRRIQEMKTLAHLAEDYAFQIQMEGSALMCEKLIRQRMLNQYENEWLKERLKRCMMLIGRWRKLGDFPIDEDDWREYYALWGEEKIAYHLGELVFRKMLEPGADIPVSEGISTQPEEWLLQAMQIVSCGAL